MAYAISLFGISIVNHFYGGCLTSETRKILE